MRAIGACLLFIACITWLAGGNAIYFRACQRKKVAAWPSSFRAWASLSAKDWLWLGTLVLVSLSLAAISIYLLSR